MKLKIIIFAILTSIASGFSWGSENCFIDLGISEYKLAACLNNPISVQSFQPSDEFGMNETKRITLPSATIDLHRNNGVYYVWRLEITGQNWSFNRKKLVVGLSQKEVIALLGKPESIDGSPSDGAYVYRLHDFDAWVNIVIRGGVVTKIFAAEDWT